ncbi:MAG: HEPN domain-containing protein [Solirubrobacterales bacterium]
MAPDLDISDAIIGFHAQQAVEKQIKAVLAGHGIPFAKSHALSYLIGLVEQNGITASAALAQADTLSPWAVEFRYEGEEPPALDRAEALAFVEQLRGWAERGDPSHRYLRDQRSAPATGELSSRERQGIRTA